MAAENSESPEDIKRLERFYEKGRESTRAQIKRDSNADWLMQNIQFGTEYPDKLWLSIGRRLSDPRIQLALQDLWWRTVEAAKLFPAGDEVRQWRLVAWIAGAKARGPVPGPPDHAYSMDDGKLLWNDLPFFEAALKNAWADRMSSSPAEWHNLNAFVARLVAVTGLDLLYLGLETISEALEVSRPIFSTSGDESVERSVSDLLPAANCWLKAPSAYLRDMTASIERALKEKGELLDGGSGVPPGTLARAGGVSRDGLSLARQRFWRIRLVEIGNEKAIGPDGDTTVADAQEWAKRLGTWNLGWPYDLKDVPGWEEPAKYQKSAS